MEIEVRGDTYTARLNGQQTTTFTNVDPLRGVSAADDPTSGSIGVQAIWFNPGHVDFRNIRNRELPATGAAAASTLAVLAACNWEEQVFAVIEAGVAP